MKRGYKTKEHELDVMLDAFNNEMEEPFLAGTRAGTNVVGHARRSSPHFELEVIDKVWAKNENQSTMARSRQ